MEEIIEPVGSTLSSLSHDILTSLKNYDPVLVGEMPPDLHYLPPHVSKVRWAALGDIVASNERLGGNLDRVRGDQWFSLRLDGAGFSSMVQKMRSNGVLNPNGFSELFAQTMRECLMDLLVYFKGSVGYTQSDEMVIFVPPTNVVHGERQPHWRNGRVIKTITLAAGYVTTQFVMKFAVACIAKGVDLAELQTCHPHFDCRLAVYDSWEDARALLMWRANDCSVNGVSDAVHHTPGSGSAVKKLATSPKLEWLWKNNHLPLPPHQAYGTLCMRAKRMVGRLNPNLGTTVYSRRNVFEFVEGKHVLELMRTDTLFPTDDPE